MSPARRAHAAYHAEPPGIEWSAMLSAHFTLDDSWLVSTPEVFLAARRVSSCWTDSQLLDLSLCDPDGDAIHVYCASGRLEDLLQYLPDPLPQGITFQRRGYRVHRWAVASSRFERMLRCAS